MDDVWFYSLGAVLAVLGAGLLLWALLTDRSKGRRRCPKCWYDLSKTEGLRCPECGKTQKSERRLFKTRRRWRWAWLVLVIWLASTYLFVQPKVRENGWASVMPTTVLILAFYLDDPTWAMGELQARMQNKEFSGFYSPAADSLWRWQWRLIAHAGLDAYSTSSAPVARVHGFKSALHAAELLKESSYDISWIAERASTGIDDRDSEIRMYAIISLGITGDYERAVPRWIEMCDSADLAKARWAASALTFSLRHDDSALDAVIDRLRHDNWQVRFNMAMGLRLYARRGGTSERAYQALVDALQFGDMETDVAYLDALMSFQGKEERSLSILVPMAGSPLANEREAAVRILGDRTDLLISAALFDPDSDVRQVASFHVQRSMERDQLINILHAIVAARLSWDITVREAADVAWQQVTEPE